MPSLLELFFCMIFLSYTKIIISHGKESCSSSCGSPQNIRYPFHLRGDPAKCGGSDFELNCESNNTILDIQKNKYYVKDISYHESIITLVDVGMPHDNCSLPVGSITWDDFKQPFFFELYHQRQATFINCSIKVDSPSYEIVPCLSKNNSTIYVTFKAFYVGDIPNQWTHHPLQLPPSHSTGPSFFAFRPIIDCVASASASVSVPGTVLANQFGLS
ncbi:hypothetical protein M5K25_027751 [Dendrobium thyrsiflorum]|uniref:RING-type E3 ubiquitin transferase n=1 Tax=Dendrobium thyrsiflorum TaxID=117978 RepID=A0ABD0TUK7_DENTH